MEGRALLAPAAPGLLDPTTVPKFVNKLDPNTLALGNTDPNTNFIYQPTGTTDVTLADGTTKNVPLYHVGAFQTQADILGLKDANNKAILTTVYGYGPTEGGADAATYPSRSFVVQQDQPIAVQWTNDLVGTKHLLPADPTVLEQGPNSTPGPGVTQLFGPYFNATLQNGQNGQWDVNFDQGGIPMVPHVHGGHTQAKYDGTPLQWFTPTTTPTTGVHGTDFPGQTTLDGPGQSTFTYDNSQQAGTIWFHDHAMGVTRLNVYAGLAGFYITHDTNETGLITTDTVAKVLPNEQFDIPLAIQDRLFTAGGQLYYPADVLKGTTASFPSVHPEVFGDTIVVDGKAWPVMDVDPRQYRFRVLDGSDSRFYNLQFNVAAGKDQPTGINQPFFQIGTDDGLLHNAVGLTQLLIAPGERADIVFDFSKFAGQTIIMTNTAKGPFPHGAPSFPQTTGQIMAFRVRSTNASTIPDATLTPATAPITVLNPNTPSFTTADVQNVRQLGLFETTDPYGRLIQKLGQKDPTTNVFSTQDYVDTTMHPMQVQLIDNGDGTQSVIEEWQVFNTTADTHPIHLHQVMFQIVSRQQFTWTVTNNPTPGAFIVTRLKGPSMGPAPNEAGWKDTVQMNPGEVTTIRAKFDLPGKYVWHCHILEHEEHDMMNEYEVVPAPK